MKKLKQLIKDILFTIAYPNVPLPNLKDGKVSKERLAFLRERFLKASRDYDRAMYPYRKEEQAKFVEKMKKKTQRS